MSQKALAVFEAMTGLCECGHDIKEHDTDDASAQCPRPRGEGRTGDIQWGCWGQDCDCQRQRRVVWTGKGHHNVWATSHTSDPRP